MARAHAQRNVKSRDCESTNHGKSARGKVAHELQALGNVRRQYGGNPAMRNVLGFAVGMKLITLAEAKDAAQRERQWCGLPA
jgi:hypothetical protein